MSEFVSAFYGLRAWLRLNAVLTGVGIFGAAMDALAATPQTITFPEIPACAPTNAPFALGATASSGLPVTYSILSTGTVAQVNNNVVTLNGITGGVTIEADQAGNGTYAPAPSVMRSFIVRSTPVFIQLAPGCQASHAMAIRSDGTLWGWGLNSSGQLGLGNSAQTNVPTQVGVATNWQMISVGASHTAGLTTDGALWLWGNGGNGQLGTGTTASTNQPARLGTNLWKTVAAGNNYTLGIQADGSLWAWGFNGNGQLGIGNTSQSNSPVQVGTEASWQTVSAGNNFTLAIKTNGTLWAWGVNFSGQLGIGNFSQSNSPVQVGVATNWLTVAVGNSSTLAIKTDGTLWAWGNNGNGQLGDGNFTSTNAPTQVGTAANWLAVAIGNVNSMGIKADGTLWTWGFNGNGQLGNGNYIQTNIPVQVGSSSNWTAVTTGNIHCLAARSDGTIWGWGGSDNGQLASQSFPALADGILTNQTVRAWSAGDNHSAVIRNDGTLWTWGLNSSSQLGDGTSLTRATPVEAGAATNWQSVSAGVAYTMAIRTDGTLWGWGANNGGQLGNGSFNTAPSPTMIGFATNWQSVSAGNGFTLAIRTDGTLWGWGVNSSGQLGLGITFNNTNVPVQVGTTTNWLAVSAGNNHTLALKKDGTLWAWGFNSNGQLGNGTSISTSSPIQPLPIAGWKAISAGNAFSFALRNDGTLFAWGININGELGDGTTSQRNSPVVVNSSGIWQSVSAGNVFSIGAKTDGTLWAWGTDGAGQLGDANNVDRNVPVQIGAINGWSAPMTSNSGRHSLVTRQGHLWAIGSNINGQAPGTDVGRPLPRLSFPLRLSQAVTIAPFTATLNSPVALSASSASGLPISWAVSGPATLSNNVLTVTGGGAVTVSAWQAGDDSAWLPTLVTNYTYVVPQPNLSVLASDGTELTDGATANFGTALLGNTSTSQTFTITNTGGAVLSGLAITASGVDASDFYISPPGATVLAAGATTTFTVIFSPMGSGVRTALLHIASNVTGSKNPYDISLTGQSLSFSQDSDGDGMSDAAEYELSAFGFNWQVSQPALVQTYYNAANLTGYYTLSQVQTLRLTKPTIAAGAGTVTLTVGLEKSLDQVNFSPFSLNSGVSTVDNFGNYQLQFTPADNAVFYRLLAR